MKSTSIRPFNHIAIIVIIFAAFFLVNSASAQEGEEPSAGWIAITSTDAESAPTVILRTIGMDSQGLPLVLAEDDIAITHGNQSIEHIRIAPDYKAGTYTLFLVDLPPGVATLLPSIEESIQQFANTPYMEERTDHMAIYRVGESEAAELLGPTNFYNSVRNYFTTPLGTQAGPTALVDSLGALLGSLHSTSPKDDLFSSIVVFTDGTDVVSSQYEPEEIGTLAAGLGIPIHTVWLQNENLQEFSQDAGRDYLAELSAQSRGIAARIDQPAEITSIWDRISSFRNQQVFEYSVPELTSGEQIVTLSLADAPDVQDLTTVTIPNSAPSVVMNVPAEGLELVLEDLNTPISLSLSAAVSWLDGLERQVTGAELLVNGIPFQDLDLETLDDFTVDIGIFNYGPNTLQVGIIDEQGFRAISPPMQLVVSEGETQIPEELEGDGVLSSTISQYLLACSLIILIGAAIALFVIVMRRIGVFDRAGRSDSPQPVDDEWTSPPKAESQAEDIDYRPAAPVSEQPEAVREEFLTRPGITYLEVVRSVTRMPPAVELISVEHRIGRSPVQADIVFENDITVSRLHASIVLEGSDYRIYDEGSTSGTLVNGQLVPDYGYQLLDGDEITLGEAVIRYRRN